MAFSVHRWAVFQGVMFFKTGPLEIIQDKSHKCIASLHLFFHRTDPTLPMPDLPFLCNVCLLKFLVFPMGPLKTFLFPGLELSWSLESTVSRSFVLQSLVT